MSRRGRGGGGGDHGTDERWLLTYADMITLLMCLFMVLWSISSVNISKLQELQRSLQQAFIGKVLTGGSSVLSGSPARIQGVQTASPSSAASDTSTIIPNNVSAPISQATQAAVNKAAQAEQQSLLHVQQQIEKYARQHGFSGSIRTTIDERGLVIRLLTDHVLFASDQATVEAPAVPLLHEIAGVILHAGIANPIRVEGNTDNVPITGGPYRDNWQLSAARATAVLEQFLEDGVPPARMSMAGYADQNPIDPNTTAAGRAANRRVDVVVVRRGPAPQGVVTP